MNSLEVFYDGGCPLCRREINYFRALKSRGPIIWLDLTDLNAELPPELDRCSALARMHVRVNGQVYYKGAAAFAMLWSQFAYWRMLGLLLRVPPVTWCADRLYSFFFENKTAPSALDATTGETLMGLDCRELLDVKEYEFLINWFMRKQKQHQLAELEEPYSYDGYSLYDQKVNQLIAEASIAFVEMFQREAPPLVFTNLFHLAELELQGKRNRILKAPKIQQ